jgi:clathrin heavy chain
MHWHKQVIALKAQQRTLQIFDLDQKVKLKSHVMSEDVLFWKWISVDTLGLVTETAVWHWNVMDSSDAGPTKMFERNQNLNVSISNASNRQHFNLLRGAKSSTIASIKTTNGW